MTRTRRSWWQRPQLRTDEEEQRDRRVGWIELFFDLFFVVVIAELAHHLSTHVSWAGVGEFVFLFVPVWWVWIGSTYYIERFETEGIEHRLIFFGQMIPIAGLAVFAHDALGETSLGYGLSYAICRTFQTFLWWRAGRHDLRFRPTSDRFVAGFSLGLTLFYLSLLVAPPGRFVLWGLSWLVDLSTPALTIRQQARLPRFSSSKLPERYGLFIIIVLGESVVGVVSGLAEQPATLLAIATGVLGLLLAFGIWWVYFDFIGRRSPKPNIVFAFFWGYGHMPLAMSITATGAGILNVIRDEDHRLDYRVGLLIAGAIAASLAIMGLIELCLQRSADEPTDPVLSPALKLGGSAIALVIGFFSGGMHVLLEQTLLLVPLLAQMAYGLYVWFTQEIKVSA